ncbi:MAG: undecaprenyl-diphosphate phosphatase [Pseudomonadota bacterium]
MPLMNLILIALIQGITEFLPISSSGHLALFPALSGEEDQGILIDVAVHVGTLVAVVAYFWREVRDAVFGGLHILSGRVSTPQAKLGLLLILATIPVVVCGLAMGLAGLSDLLRNVEVIAWATLIFGVVLWAADRYGGLEKQGDAWGWRDAALMGLAQAVALIPGTSRSGITITAGRALGYARVDAARIAMLMSVPTILAAGALASLDLIQSGDAALGLDAAIAAGLSCIAALAALTVMMKMLETWSLTPFVLYRLALGAALLVWIYGFGGPASA